jgi:hypothetical protein
MLDLPGKVVLYAGGVRRLPVLDEDQHTEEHVDELLLGPVTSPLRRQRPAYPLCRRIKCSTSTLNRLRVAFRT